MRLTQLFLFILTIFGAAVHAQSPSYDPRQMPTYDAGALARQAEQMFKQSQQSGSQAQRASLPPELVLTEGASVTAQRFKFNGNRVVSNDQLQPLTASFVNRALYSRDLQQLTHAITEAYRHTGWIVHAYIPRQPLSGPELTVQVIESIPPSKPAQ